MEFVIHDENKIHIFTDIFNPINNFTDVINLQFYEDRLYVQSMDSTHVLLFEIVLRNTWFDSYKYTKPMTVGINCKQFSAFLKAHGKTQSFRFSCDPDNKDGYCFNYFTHTLEKIIAEEEPELELEPEEKKGKKKGKKVEKEKEKEKKMKLIAKNIDHEFDIEIVGNLVDIESDSLLIPETEHTAIFSLPSTKFSKIINNMQSLSDSITIHCDENKINITASSQETGAMTVDIPICDLTYFGIDEGASLNLQYAIKYVNKICTYEKISNDVYIKITNDQPLCITYYLDKVPDDEDENKNIERITFYLAPKIDDN